MSPASRLVSGSGSLPAHQQEPGLSYPIRCQNRWCRNSRCQKIRCFPNSRCQNHYHRSCRCHRNSHYRCLPSHCSRKSHCPIHHCCRYRFQNPRFLMFLNCRFHSLYLLPEPWDLGWRLRIRQHTWGLIWLRHSALQKQKFSLASLTFSWWVLALLNKGSWNFELPLPALIQTVVYNRLIHWAHFGLARLSRDTRSHSGLDLLLSFHRLRRAPETKQEKERTEFTQAALACEAALGKHSAPQSEA